MLQPRNDAQPGDTDPAEAPDGLPNPRRAWAIAAISFGTALLVVDAAIANVALPTIARELNVSDGAVTSVVTVYQLVIVMGLLPFANLGDRFGLRRVYQLGQMLFCAASALCFFADSFATLLLLRGAQALGAGMALAVGTALIREIYPEGKLGTGLGINSVIIASSYAIAPTLGGYIAENYAWQILFVIAAPLALISLLLGRAMPDVPQRTQEIQLASGLWSAATFALFVGGVQLFTHDHPYLGVAGIVGGVVSAVFLTRSEGRKTAPVVPVDLLRRPALGLTALAGFSVFIASGAISIALPFRLEQAMGYSPTEVGLLFVPFPATLLIVAPLAGWLSDRVAPTKLGVGGMGLAVVGMLLLAFMPNDSGAFDIAWRLVLTAVGYGFFVVPNSRMMIGSAPRARSAAAGGLMGTTRLFGQTLAAAAVGIMLTVGVGTGPVPLVFAAGLGVIAAACSITRFTTSLAKGGERAAAAAGN